MIKLSQNFMRALTEAQRLAIEQDRTVLTSDFLLFALAGTDPRLKEAGVTTEALTQAVKKSGENLTHVKESQNEILREGFGFQTSEELDNLLEKAILLSLSVTEENIVTTHTVIIAMLREKNSNAHYLLEALPSFKGELLESVVIATARTNDDVPLSPVPAGVDEHTTTPENQKTTKTKPGSVPKQIADAIVNLSEQARDGELDPIFNRETEIERTLLTLSRRTKNNPVIIGDPGVGKTAIVEGLAQALANPSNVQHDALQGRDIWSIDMGALVSGTRYRGDFEEKLKTVIKSAQDANAILFIDEIHTLLGGGKSSSSQGSSAADILKPVLARGELSTIGATTYTEYRQIFEKDAALSRRFQPVEVKEPDHVTAVAMLQHIQQKYAEHHQVEYSPDAIAAAVELSARYIPDRRLPDKAIDLLDEAGVIAHFRHITGNDEVRNIELRLKENEEAKESLLEEESYELIPNLIEEREKLLTSLAEAKKAPVKASKTIIPPVVSAADIAAVLTASTGIPVTVPAEEREHLLTLETRLNQQVIEQTRAVAAVSRIVRRQRAGLKDPNRPAGSFFFAGPTGVGKTELAKALAVELFGSEDKLITLDMSEYGEKENIARLFGAPPGYVGHEEGGQLTEAVKRNPYSVVLFDEVEKAHPDVFNPLLQVLEEGRLTDGQGRVVDFKNTIIIMTSNIGASKLTTTPIGFQIADDGGANSYAIMKSKVFTELKKEFKPEFLNRLDDIIVFPALTKTGVATIFTKFLHSINTRLADQHVTVAVSDTAKDWFAANGYNPDMGARPLRRLMQKRIEDPVSEILLNGDTPSEIAIDFTGNALTYNGALAADLAKVRA